MKVRGEVALETHDPLSASVAPFVCSMSIQKRTVNE